MKMEFKNGLSYLLHIAFMDEWPSIISVDDRSMYYWNFYMYGETDFTLQLKNPN